MEIWRGRVLAIGFALAVIHAASYVILASIHQDHVQTGQGIARLILVGLLGAASLTYELALRGGTAKSAQRTAAAAAAAPDLTIPAVLLLVATLYALTAWPSLYRGWWGEDGYDYRTHRITGTTEWKCDTRWKPVTPGTELPRPFRHYP